MKAAVLTIKDFLKMKNTTETEFFKTNISKYSIPMYQREYKWKTNMVEDLFYDIEDKDKFLGIVALEECEDIYEIVDGQQRITTLLLMIIEIFNGFKTDAERNADQVNLLQYVGETERIIKNETIGEFININKNEIYVEISDATDIYRQKSTFTTLINTIKELYRFKFGNTESKNEIDRNKLDKFRRKLLDCKILVFINSSNRENESTEEIYVDINQKSQHLDIEDIYKGYCFQKSNKEQHDLVKKLWVENKKIGFKFSQYFGIEKFDDFLYIYYLSQPDTYGITQKLEKNKRHILNEATSTDVFRELESMKSYGKTIFEAYKKAIDSDYKFHDISNNAKDYDGTFYFKKLKRMILYIMRNNKVQYHKLPFFVFLEKLYKDVSTDNELDFDILRKVITNYYIYAVYFIWLIKNKNKNTIEMNNIKTIKNIEGSINNSNIKDIGEEIKRIRKTILMDVDIIDEKFNKEESYDLYALWDNFEQDKQKLDMFYSLEEGYNDEHLIIHQNNRIDWMCNDTKKITIGISKYKRYKEKLINHLIIPVELNEELESFDIITKIVKIKEYYTKIKAGKFPNHISYFINIIESSDEYKELIKIKDDNQKDLTIIESKYFEFIEKYFDNEVGYSLRIRQGILNYFKTL